MNTKYSPKKELFRELSIPYMMNEFGVISSGSKAFFNHCMVQSARAGNKIDFDTTKRYFKQLRERNMVRKIDNRNYLVNPRYAVKNNRISTNKLFQLERNWNRNRVQDVWLKDKNGDIAGDTYSVETAIDKEKLNKILEEESEMICSIYLNKDKYIPAIKDFITLTGLEDLDSFISLIKKEVGIGKFRKWYNEQFIVMGYPEVGFKYAERKKYARAFIHIADKEIKVAQ